MLLALTLRREETEAGMSRRSQAVMKAQQKTRPMPLGTLKYEDPSELS